MPNRTIDKDECSINELSDLAIDGEHLSVSLSYQFACGAGSEVNVTHVLSIDSGLMRLEQVQMEFTLRDRLNIVQIDFSDGKVKNQDDHPEEVIAPTPNIATFQPYRVPIDLLTLIRCPYPLHGKAMPNCVITSKIDAAHSSELQKSTTE